MFNMHKRIHQKLKKMMKAHTAQIAPFRIVNKHSTMNAEHYMNVSYACVFGWYECIA